MSEPAVTVVEFDATPALASDRSHREGPPNPHASNQAIDHATRKEGDE